MLTWTFWKAALERAIKTFAQAALVVYGGDQVNAWQADWSEIGYAGLSGAGLSVLMSIGSYVMPMGEGASLVEISSTGRHAKPE